MQLFVRQDALINILNVRPILKQVILSTVVLYLHKVSLV